MPTLSRRSFMSTAAVLGAAVAGAGACTTHPGSAGSGPHGDATAGDAPSLVVVTLAGGNDWLNTVVPAGDGTYRDSRGDLAIGADEVLDIGDGFGLHPKLSNLSQRFNEGDVAVVHGVAPPRPSLSHFESADTWQRGDPDHPGATGWIGRWLDKSEHDPFRALAIGNTLPLALAGAEESGAVLSVSGPVPRDDALTEAWYATADSADGAVAFIGRSMDDLRRLGPAQRVAMEGMGGEAGNKARGRARLDDALAAAGRLLNGGFGTRVVSVVHEGYDTHSAQRDTQERLLGELDSAVGTFFAELGESNASTTLLVWSEFGRRVASNGSGTDHGTAGNVLLMGGMVRGGHHGDPCRLDDLDDDGNLRPTTDFRSVYGAVLASVLDADPGAVLPDPPAPLDLF